MLDASHDSSFGSEGNDCPSEQSYCYPNGRFPMGMPLINILIYEYALPVSSVQLDAWKEICFNVLISLRNLQSAYSQ
ncbi:hypothetical protein [Nostoc sp.]|uniref:hypothetical protein n=1 Tax=Nostoc sp. TaxID=1180 RepID=UPI002FF86DCA